MTTSRINSTRLADSYDEFENPGYNANTNPNTEPENQTNTVELHCTDCNIDLFGIKEYYSIKDRTQAEANIEQHDYLCVGCIEKRLNRQLTFRDFREAPLNVIGDDHSERLNNRIRDGLPKYSILYPHENIQSLIKARQHAKMSAEDFVNNYLDEHELVTLPDNEPTFWETTADNLNPDEDPELYKAIQKYEKWLAKGKDILETLTPLLNKHQSE